MGVLAGGEWNENGAESLRRPVLGEQLTNASHFPPLRLQTLKLFVTLSVFIASEGSLHAGAASQGMSPVGPRFSLVHTLLLIHACRNVQAPGKISFTHLNTHTPACSLFYITPY